MCVCEVGRGVDSPEIVPFQSFVPPPLISPVKMIAGAEVGTANNAQEGREDGRD